MLLLDAARPVRRGRPGVAVAAAGGLAYLSVAYAIDPYQERAVGCPVRALGGFCPGCGSTRAVHELLHGDLAQSIACHPLVLPVAVLLAGLGALAVARRVRPERAWPTATDVPQRAVLVLVAAFVALTVARNGFALLLPPTVG